MTMTQRDAQALTYLAGRIREETRGAAKWDDHGTYTVIARLIGQHLGTSIEQVIRHAGDPEARTPGAIERPFLPPPSTPTKRTGPPKRAEECRTHIGQYADHCGGCYADKLAETDDPNPEETTMNPTHLTGAALVRAAMREGGAS